MINIIEVASEAERAALFAVREEVFVREQNVPKEEEYDAYDSPDAPAAHYLALADDGQPVGAARWRRTANGVKLERFAVLAPYRKAGVGAALVARLVADAQAAHPGARLYLHAQEHALNFYARHGFEAEGERFYECDIPHFKMTRA